MVILKAMKYYQSVNTYHDNISTCYFFLPPQHGVSVTTTMPSSASELKSDMTALLFVFSKGTSIRASKAGTEIIENVD